MEESKKRNYPLIIGLSIPAIMILVVVVSVYLPSFFVKPKFNFVYMSGYDYYYDRSYRVENGRLARYPVPTPPYPPPSDYARREPRFYLYDVQNDTNRELTFDEAQRLMLNADPRSPDGYEVVPGSSSEGIFPLMFSRSDYNSRYIKGSFGSKKLNVRRDGPYDYQFQFLGWVIQ